MEPIVRLAGPADLEAINAIYNHYVLHSTATYQLEPGSFEGHQRWFASRRPQHPTVVVEEDGCVVAWGSLSPYRERAAYERTVENSVYVRHDRQRRGYGSLIIRDLIARGRALGHHTIVAVIDAEQPASVAMHARLGFTEVGRLRQVGWKFGRWLDVVVMQVML